MADDVLEELWRIKDELGAEAKGDLLAFCQQMNQKAQKRGVHLVDRSSPSQLMVAEKIESYKGQ